jgi:hypothetical protein
MNLIELIGSIFSPGLAMTLLLWTLVYSAIHLFFSAIMDGPRWKRWEGSIVTGIKLAEKEVPSTVHNAGLARLDRAMAYVTQAYREMHHGRRPSKRLLAQLRQGIQLKHDELERYGALRKRG